MGGGGEGHVEETGKFKGMLWCMIVFYYDIKWMLPTYFLVIFLLYVRNYAKDLRI